MTGETFHIVGVAGSLRRLSVNRGLLAAARELAPDGVEVEVVEIGALPLYNEDLNVDGGPEPVRAFKERIARADALLFATPEYNYSMTGVLKNAIDWASRPLASSPLRHKPAALMSAGANSRFGGARAQLALRQVFLFTKSYVMLEPELIIPQAQDYFDAEGRLTDEVQRQRIRTLVVALVAWSRQVAPSATS